MCVNGYCQNFNPGKAPIKLTTASCSHNSLVRPFVGPLVYWSVVQDFYKITHHLMCKHVTNLATNGVTCTKLAIIIATLPLGLHCWLHQFVLSWYLYQPESHQLGLNIKYRQTGIDPQGSDKNLAKS